MILILGLTTTMAGWGMMLGGVIDGADMGLGAGTVQMATGLIVAQLGYSLVLGGAMLRVLDRQVRDNFDKLFTVLGEEPSTRRAMELFEPIATGSQSGRIADGHIRTLRRRAAVA